MHICDEKLPLVSQKDPEYKRDGMPIGCEGVSEMSNGPVSVPLHHQIPRTSLFAHAGMARATRSGLMVPDEFKNLGFQDGEAGAKEKGNATKSGNRLEELRRENAELLKKHATEKKQ